MNSHQPDSIRELGCDCIQCMICKYTSITISTYFGGFVGRSRRFLKRARRICDINRKLLYVKYLLIFIGTCWILMWRFLPKVCHPARQLLYKFCGRCGILSPPIPRRNVHFFLRTLRRRPSADSSQRELGAGLFFGAETEKYRRPQHSPQIGLCVQAK